MLYHLHRSSGKMVMNGEKAYVGIRMEAVIHLVCDETHTVGFPGNKVGGGER
jgi:hypothetical protein